ncbi:hypothetical protein AC624_06740 [Bacillus sp. FJAT-27238]|nr:hypothetical protein AC624_06740 [Bacillus sp. FJAT-27238]
MHFEEFLYKLDLNCILQNGKLHLIQKWIKQQREDGVAYSIKRRIASLSSIFSFYRDLGVIQQNCFRAVEVPPGHQDHHSPILDMEQLKEVYQYANQLEESESHFGPTIKLLVLSGLRNDALTNLKVQDLHIEKSLLCLNENSVTINTKHKVQLIPLPPILMSELIDHINKHKLQAEDKLLFGLAGLPLGDKALNRITDRLSSVLQLSRFDKVTPHGFRATISTLLSERGIDLNSIRFLLGHSEKDNLHFYIRRYGRHIQVLRRELTRLEEELAQKNARLPDSANLQNKMGEVYLSQSPIIQKETLIQLLQTHPDVAAMILQKGLVQL